jgi:hypothetical protein
MAEVGSSLLDLISTFYLSPSLDVCAPPCPTHYDLFDFISSSVLAVDEALDPRQQPFERRAFFVAKYNCTLLDIWGKRVGWWN